MQNCSLLWLLGALLKLQPEHNGGKVVAINQVSAYGNQISRCLGSLNHRQANLQMIKLWPRSGLGRETRTGQVFGAVDRPRRCRLGILSPACRASSWYPSAILSMRAFTTGSFIASAAVRISSARFRQCSGLCKRYRRNLMMAPDSVGLGDLRA